jgi:YidC/Oxa1 family membrane protein insertase
MKQFLQKKAKLVFLCMLVLLTCTACANPRGRDGKTLADQIIASEETTIDASKINYKDISDKDLNMRALKRISKMDNIQFNQQLLKILCLKDGLKV